MTGSGAPPTEVTLHSSWRGIVGSFLGALIIAGLGLLAGFGGRWNVLSVSLCVVGAVFVIGVAVDYPVASTFDTDGVVRRTLLRRQSLRWERVTHLTRARPGMAASLGKMSLGGLVARIGRRRYLLVDQPESGTEYDELEQVLAAAGSDVPDIDRVIRPGDAVSPTWIYRRRRWRREVVRR